MFHGGHYVVVGMYHFLQYGRWAPSLQQASTALVASTPQRALCRKEDGGA